jgi:hypothetical protein
MIAIVGSTKQMHRKVISIDPELDGKKGGYFVAVVFTAAANGLRSVAGVL